MNKKRPSEMKKICIRASTKVETDMVSTLTRGYHVTIVKTI